MPQVAIPIGIAVGGALLSKALAPKPPKLEGPVAAEAGRLPTVDDERAKQARRRAQLSLLQRSGRDSTILTDSSQTLGGG